MTAEPFWSVTPDELCSAAAIAEEMA